MKQLRKKKVVVNNKMSIIKKKGKKNVNLSGHNEPKQNAKSESKLQMKKKAVKTIGKFQGKSNALGQGGRAAQMKAQGVPGGVIGNLARAAQAAPGQKNFHKKKSVSKGAKAYLKRVGKKGMEGKC